MLHRIGSLDNIPAFIERVKAREASRACMAAYACQGMVTVAGSMAGQHGTAAPGPFGKSASRHGLGSDRHWPGPLCVQEIMFGFGHRVYKNYDPRAKIIRTVADQARAASASIAPTPTTPLAPLWPHPHARPHAPCHDPY